MGSHRQHRAHHGRRRHPDEGCSRRPPADRQRSGHHGRHRDQERRFGGDMNGSKRRVDGDQIFWGLLLVAAGVFLLLGRLGIADFSWTLRKFWPVIVIIIGVSKLIRRRSIWEGLWMITIGAWLQAVTLHFHGFTYESSWPLLLVVLGAGIIVRTIVGSPRDREERESDHV